MVDRSAHPARSRVSTLDNRRLQTRAIERGHRSDSSDSSLTGLRPRSRKTGIPPLKCSSNDTQSQYYLIGQSNATRRVSFFAVGGHFFVLRPMGLKTWTIMRPAPPEEARKMVLRAASIACHPGGCDGLVRPFAERCVFTRPFFPPPAVHMNERPVDEKTA